MGVTLLPGVRADKGCFQEVIVSDSARVSDLVQLLPCPCSLALTVTGHQSAGGCRTRSTEGKGKRSVALLGSAMMVPCALS